LRGAWVAAEGRALNLASIVARCDNRIPDVITVGCQMPQHQTEYSGPERRRRKVYLTRNTEYHFHDEVCVAVRHRDTDQWRMAHVTLQRKLSGCVSYSDHGDVQPKAGPPSVGDSLYFSAEGVDVITSTLTDVSRPLPQTIATYPI
jgi:hypothetical protein